MQAPAVIITIQRKRTAFHIQPSVSSKPTIITCFIGCCHNFTDPVIGEIFFCCCGITFVHPVSRRCKGKFSIQNVHSYLRYKVVHLPVTGRIWLITAWISIIQRTVIQCIGNFSVTPAFKLHLKSSDWAVLLIFHTIDISPFSTPVNVLIIPDNIFHSHAKVRAGCRTFSTGWP